MHALPRFVLHAARAVILGSVVFNSVQAAPPSPSSPVAASSPVATSSPAAASSAAAASSPAAASAPAAMPDYGGRDSAPLSTSGETPNPAAQAGRAVEALVVVLVGVVGVIYALRRFGLVKPGVNGQPARIALPGRAAPNVGASSVAVLSSQSLPGGTMLHVVQVDDRCLLLAATAQSVNSVAEWPAGLNISEGTADFEDYLTRADDAPNSGIAAANARLRSLLSRPDLEEPK